MTFEQAVALLTKECQPGGRLSGCRICVDDTGLDFVIPDTSHMDWDERLEYKARRIGYVNQIMGDVEE